MTPPLANGRARIGQITDIHVWDPADLRPLDFATKRLTGWVNHRMSRRHEYAPRVLNAAIDALVAARPDCVVVSGDLSNLGLRSELLEARRRLERIDQAGIPLAVIPGNHDAYLRSCTKGRFEAIFADWQRNDGHTDGPYPFLRRVGPARLLCFNSAIPTAPMFAYGRVDDDQLGRARELLAQYSEGPLMVALHHHPIRAVHKRIDVTRELKGGAAFRAFCVEHGAALIVHGHNHFHHLARLGGATGPLVAGITSGTTNRTEPAERRAEVAVYEFDRMGLVSMEVARWEPDRDGFGGFAPEPLAALKVVA